MTRFSLLFCGLLLSLFACAPKSNVTGERISSPNGDYEYLWLVDAPGDTVEINDYVEYHAYVRNGEDVKFSTRDGTGDPVRNQLTKEAAREPLVQMLFRMSPGDSVAVFTPLPPGQPTPPDFEGATEVRYDIVLLNELTKEEYDASIAQLKEKQEAAAAEFKAAEAEIARRTATALAEYKADNIDDLQTTPSGLKYVVLKEGTGPKPTVGERVSVNYYGMLTTGEEFDNSYKRGQPFQFQLGAGRVIKGWDEGVALLNGGSEAVFFIPADLAYGAQESPTIPANSELVFFVSLEE